MTFSIPRPLQATLVLLFTCTLWGLSFPLARALTLLASREVPGMDLLWLSQALLAVRFFLAALLLWLGARGWNHPPITEEWRQGLGLGLTTGLGMILQLDGLARTSGSVCAFLSVASCVVLVPLAHSGLRGRWPTRRVLFCLGTVFLGIILISGVSGSDLKLGRGEVECLGAGGLFTLQVLWVERPAFDHNRASTASWIMFATMALVALPGTLFPEQATSWGRAVLPLKQGWILMAALVGPCTLLTFPLMNAWQRHVGATAAGLVYCAEPVLAGLYCTFVPAGLSVFLKLDYPNEILTPRFVAGAGLITLANVALSWRRPD